VIKINEQTQMQQMPAVPPIGHVPQQVSPPVRLSSVHPTKQPTAQSNGLAQVVKAAPPLPECVLDVVQLGQWKHVKTLRDPFIALHRGRHAFRDIALYLESGLGHLVRYGLNQLQVLLLENACVSPDPVSTVRLVGLLFGACISEDKSDDASLSLWELSRRSTQRQYKLHEDNSGFEVTELVTNTLRALVTRSDAKSAFCLAIGQHAGRLQRWAVSSSSHEVRKNALLVLAELPPTILARLSDGLLGGCLRDLNQLVPLLAASSHRLMLGWESFPEASEGVEALKKSIVGLIPAATSVFRTIPALAFIELEIVYKVLLQHALSESRPSPHTCSLILSLMNPLLQLLRLILQSVLKLSALIQALLSQDSDEFRRGAEYGKWLHKILHNTGFGLPDGGYLELLLLCMSVGVECMGEAQVMGFVEESEMVRSLIAAVAGLRRFWEIPPTLAADGRSEVPLRFERQVHVSAGGPSSRGIQQRAQTQTLLTEKSPLLWHACTSPSSQPYQLFLACTRLLDCLAQVAPTQVGAALHGHVGVLISWQCAGHDSAIAMQSREVLLTAELRERYARLLACILQI